MMMFPFHATVTLASMTLAAVVAPPLVMATFTASSMGSVKGTTLEYHGLREVLSVQ
jgi:hypothetical protein